MTFTSESVARLVETVRNLYEKATEYMDDSDIHNFLRDGLVTLTPQEARGYGLTEIAEDLELATEEDEEK